MQPTQVLHSSVTCPYPNPHASLRLFCFPYAGGNSLIFRPWLKSLPTTVEVCPVELPGRGIQMKLAPISRLELLIKSLASTLLPHLNQPFAFFGHSMGALISFELTRLLRREYNISPVHLFISGRRAPQIPDPKPPIHALPEPEFIEELRRLNGTPQAVLENTELMQLLIPTLRADFAVLETYAYTPEPTLNVPITTFGGLQDSEVNFDELQAWQAQTHSTFSQQMFPGNHFFLHSAQSLLLQSLSQQLNRITSEASC
ncbi:thioesterase II family protein [Gloeocapsopsis dulcis]|uniref:Putative thioesterase n=1 Tax=Gloeocapsopsis dulcis AAB1 = 1H9 TaxID=1433147 RepID=A0A6N8FXM9_9CHRO|nr:alpha/beta fold hydrolase [Gloeocapsopsis dulcis]MUL37888.1 putative thioesterase [Gloeocapsopsis dulcis AAB1 = 1H9]WNN92305.1 thioesterase domain-containing protein [Gloeocapsopsis dulcis]